MASSPYLWQLQHLPARRSCCLDAFTDTAIPALIKGKARAAVRHREGKQVLVGKNWVGYGGFWRGVALIGKKRCERGAFPT